MTRWLWRVLPALALLVLLASAVWLAAGTERSAAALGQAYGGWFAAASVSMVVLVISVLREVWLLLRDRRNLRPGAQLQARLALLLGLIALPSTLLVAAFALRFLDAGIDAWFRTDLEAAHRAARDLGGLVLAEEERRAAELLDSIASTISNASDGDVQAEFDARLEADAALRVHLSSYADDGTLEASAFSTSAIVQPPEPDASLRLQVEESTALTQSLLLGEHFATRALRLCVDTYGETHLLQLIVPLPESLAPALEQLETTSVDYGQLRFEREALKTSFGVILVFVSLLAMLAALLAALAVSRRLTRPIAELAEATTIIGEGRFGIELPVRSVDDLGALTRAFNRMSHDLAELAEREQSSRNETEQARSHLDAVLSRLSAGVLSIDLERVLTANAAAADLLDYPLAALRDVDLDVLAKHDHANATVVARVRARIAEGRHEWRDEIALPGDPPRALLIRAVRLPGQAPRFVVIVDDMTVIAQAQREAAWSDVARRLAHEIKNPLTPIQLAAERMKHRFTGKLDAADSQVLERATQTIVAQVEALKLLVNGFGDYARPARIDVRPLSLPALVGEVLDLYETSGQCQIERDLDFDLPSVRGDRERLRQLLVNLLTNAVEAGGAGVRVAVRLQRLADQAELSLRDHGPGLPAGFDGRWFEPYMSTKPKGGGLGLAMVQKIAEEHGGRIRAENADGGGALFILLLPIRTGVIDAQ